MKGCHTTGLILSAILGIGLSLIYHYQPIEIRLKTPTENAIKNHYANYSYRDPFEDIALTTDERYIFNYAIAQLFLEDQFKNKPYGIPRAVELHVDLKLRVVDGVSHAGRDDLKLVVGQRELRDILTEHYTERIRDPFVVRRKTAFGVVLRYHDGVGLPAGDQERRAEGDGRELVHETTLYVT